MMEGVITERAMQRWAGGPREQSVIAMRCMHARKIVSLGAITRDHKCLRTSRATTVNRTVGAWRAAS